MFPPANTPGSSTNSPSKTGQIDTSDERKAFDSIDDSVVDKGKADKKADKKPEPKESDEDESVDDVETDEEIDDDESDEEKVDEEDDETVSEDDTVYQSLKKADKDIFKKVPELRQIIFREQKFTEYFSTVDAAKEAAEAVEVFNEYQADLVAGRSDNLLSALEKTDKKALESFVANFIPTLEKQNKTLYLDMIFPEFKKLCRAASRSNDENLKNAAYHLHNYIFGDTDLSADAGLKANSGKPAEEDELTTRERNFEQKQFQSFHSDVMTVGMGRVEREIGKAFKNTDISPLLQKSLTKEIMDRVDSKIQKDTRHMGNINHLWDQAKRNGFTSDWKDRIINAYLSRARLLIPPVRQAVLSEAKLNAKMGVVEAKEKTRIPSSGSAVNRQSGAKIDSKKIDWSKAGDERSMLEGNIPMKK